MKKHPSSSARQWLILAALVIPSSIVAVSCARVGARRSPVFPKAGTSRSVQAGLPVLPAPLIPPLLAPPPGPTQIAAAERDANAHPGDIAASVHLADDYRRAGRLPAAAARLRQALQRSPRSVPVYRELAAVFQDAGYLDREMGTLKALISLDPGDWQAMLRLAHIYINLGWFPNSHALLAQAFRLAPREPEVYLTGALEAYMLAEHGKMQQWDQRGLKVDPRNASLHASYAEALRIDNQIPAAERELKTAIALSSDPAQKSADYRDLSHLLLQVIAPAPRYAEAEAAARMAIELDPSDWQAHYWLARALHLQGKTAMARAEYEKVAAHDVDFEATAYQLGRLDEHSTNPGVRSRAARLLATYQQDRTNQRTYDSARASLSAHLNNANDHANVAGWYLAQQQYSNAIVELERALELDPGDRSALLALIGALKETGRLTEARAIMEKLNRKQPGKAHRTRSVH